MRGREIDPVEILNLLANFSCLRTDGDGVGFRLVVRAASHLTGAGLEDSFRNSLSRLGRAVGRRMEEPR